MIFRLYPIHPWARFAVAASRYRPHVPRLRATISNTTIDTAVTAPDEHDSTAVTGFGSDGVQTPQDDAFTRNAMSVIYSISTSGCVMSTAKLAAVTKALHEVDMSHLNHFLETVNTDDLVRVFLCTNRQLDRADPIRLQISQHLQTLLPFVRLTDRIRLVEALQRSREGDERFREIVHLFHSAKGSDLTQMKNILEGPRNSDSSGLFQLVWHDMKHVPGLRAELLKHFHDNVPNKHPMHVKIISDLSDTIYVRMHDRRYPVNTVYPGVRQLFEELDVGANETDMRGDVCYVTSRPTLLGEYLSRRALIRLGFRPGTILTGHLLYLWGNRMATRKLWNLKRYEQLFPEYRFVMFGDSGQSDIGFLQRAVTQFGRDRIPLAVIHNVTALPSEQIQLCKQAGVDVVDTYVKAALLCFQKRLISEVGLQRVVQQAQKELNEVQFDSEAQRRQRWREMEQDVTEVAKMM
eukprot:TRINITY_DN756_c0_g1_i1.p1 TRINITY_DN756_c0_g1~~TRINITY_DN756_c0_g1_i1.p1  ORF type:complete len:464 (-),score=69.28 TRINITY_DN756_c0_g1_i1:513-1904(-)